MLLVHFVDQAGLPLNPHSRFRCSPASLELLGSASDFECPTTAPRSRYDHALYIARQVSPGYQY